MGIPDSGQYLIGRELGYLRVDTTDDLEAVIRRTSANIAVLSVPASAAPSLRWQSKLVQLTVSAPAECAAHAFAKDGG